MKGASLTASQSKPSELNAALWSQQRRWAPRQPSGILIFVGCTTKRVRVKPPRHKRTTNRHVVHETQLSGVTWPWGTTYGSILGWMNIHLPPILMFTRVFLGFDPQTLDGHRGDSCVGSEPLRPSSHSCRALRAWMVLQMAMVRPSHRPDTGVL